MLPASAHIHASFCIFYRGFFSTPALADEAKFYEHVKQYKLDFASGEEFAMRLEVFAANDDTIEAHNNGPESTFTLGHNEYSHLTWAEFQTMFQLGQPYELKKHGGKVHEASGETAASWNWEAMGKVTPVKNQGQCGSCWSFSTTGSLEGAYGIAQNMNISTWSGFSEQQLVSCDTTDSGCNGGLMDTAFMWIKGNGGICSEADYPYTSSGGTNGACLTSCQNVASSSPASYTDVAATDAALQDAITQQPVSVAIQANQPAFQLYAGGVLTGRCGDRLDHGVLAVGYGTWTDGVTEYWQVKNSWGNTWGMAGYILIEKGGAAPKGGECGILEMASYPNM